MTPRQVARRIGDLVTKLTEEGVVVDFNMPVVRSFGGSSLVTWSALPNADQLVSFEPFATLSEYRRFVEQRQYTCVLYDGSLLQLSYVLRGNNLEKHRLVYFPCPFEHSAEEGAEIDLLTALEQAVEAEAFETTATDSELTGLRLMSPIRFDYDLGATGLHPSSHVHFGKDESRCAVFGPLSLGHFVRFVFQVFYPSVWRESAFLQGFAPDPVTRSVTADEEMELHFDARQAMTTPPAGA